MEDRQKKGTSPERSHHRQVFFQIYLPVLGAVLVVVILITWLILSSSNSPSLTQNWAHISALILVVPFILLSIFFLTILCLAVFGMAKLNRYLPDRLVKVRKATEKMNERSQQVISKTAEPVIKTRVFFSSGQAVLRGIKGFFTRIGGNDGREQ